MKFFFLILVMVHGLIHILGFLKAFGFAEIKDLTLPVSKFWGLLWLLATVLFLIYGIAFFTGYTYSWLFGLIALVISQVLIIYFWAAAKVGTLPNVIILLVVISAVANFRFDRMVAAETHHTLSGVAPGHSKIIEEGDIGNLPEAVQKWLKSTGIIGKPAIQSGRVVQKALMKMKPDQENWSAASALQYTTTNPPAFIWTVALKMMPLVNIKGRDQFLDGHGEMLIKINALLPIVKERGPKLDEGTLQRFLGEVVWFPSMALSPYITWEGLDDTSARATMQYKDSKASGTFYFNEQGDFIKFVALRYKGNEPEAQRYPWVLTVDDYAEFDGIRVPVRMKATWELEEGDWTWLDLEIVDLKYN
jgi:lipoprotein signal peptidase